MTSAHIAAKRLAERGVSALFIVLFASMLFSLIAVSFTAIMVREQGRSFDDEQSQGAYDAALVGVEDGKRVLELCLDGDSDACDAIDAEQCNTTRRAAGDTTNYDEIPVRTDSTGSGESLNMAYTCVIINPSTPNVLKTLNGHDSSAMVELQPEETVSFEKVRISWFTQADVGTVSGLGTDTFLEGLGSWGTNKPPVLRVQTIQYDKGNFTGAGTFDDENNSSTRFLYPTDGVGLGEIDGLEDAGRRIGDLGVESVNCNDDFNLVEYSCEVILTIPSSLSADDRAAFLRITSIYRGTSVRVQMLDGADAIVNFDNVQPSIDATGRANDLFRRVESRVEYTNGNSIYPRATIDIRGNLCKVFSITNDTADYDDGYGICNPNT